MKGKLRCRFSMDEKGIMTCTLYTGETRCNKQFDYKDGMDALNKHQDTVHPEDRQT